MKQPLAEFSMTGLHGERDVKIPFDDPVKIIVAENGFGKTTILNSLYALIFGDFQKLRRIQFKSISLVFQSGTRIDLDKNDFNLNFEVAPQTGMLQHFKTMFSNDFLANLYEDYRSLTRKNIRSSPIFGFAHKEVVKRFNGLSDENLIQWLDALSAELANASLYGPKVIEAQKTISSEFSFEAIYLPTYRRIEEDLRNLSYLPEELGLGKPVIQFGMHDVQARFDNITAEIKNSSIEWFAKINGQMLTQLILGINLTDEMRIGLHDDAALRIVLERIGDNMPAQEKSQILQLIQSGQIFNDHKPLAYFLANLVKVYEQQKTNDNAIKIFTERCNKYLVDKKVVYDESAVEITIKRTKNNKIVAINTLSSGEKQIISLFSRLFLTKSNKVAIFFDEPELSLSIEWQKQLLPDIIESGLCGFLFCTTHSPFIFDNHLAQFASGLDRYIKEL